jgi:oxygen-independent coproporphyrinogen-3 oxidase
MDPATTAALIERITCHFDCEPDLEITLEANPSSVEAGRFAGFRQAGVNRLSLGIQALDDRALKFLGRTHDHRQALSALDVAANTFERYSFDLIYARPDQTDRQWRTELATALRLAGDHVSLYQLTIERGTAFARDGVKACPEGLGETLYHTTNTMLEAAGLPAYEISNHARPGAACAHNLTYWRGGGYLGIGPGAHGRLNRPSGWQAHHRIHNPARWIEAVQTKGHGTAKQTPLSPLERRDEAVMMGLRLVEGISTVNFKAATGLDLATAFEPNALKTLIDGGFVEHTPDNLRATGDGLLRLDGVITRLLVA